MQERKTGVLISSRDIELPKEDKNSKCEFAAFIDDKAKKQDCMRRDLADWIGIDSERFRKIVNKSNPTKKRDCIIACGFALRLNSGETCDALFMYNFPRLDDGLKREEYISTLLDEQASKKVLFWSLEDVNSRLRTMGFPELDVIAHRRGRKAVNPINPPQRYRIDGVCIDSCLAEHVFDNRLSSLATEYSPDQFRVFAKIRLTDVWMCKSYEIIAEPDGHYSRIDYPIESHECLHSYTSLEETGDMRALYESAQGYAQRELAKKALVVKDTRNYRDRISACVIKNSLHIFTETYNYDMPELQEYFLLDYADGEFQFSVSEESRFMELYLSPDDYEKYYGVASQRGEVSFSSEEERPFTREGMTGSILSKGSLEPMTPVEAVRISSALQPRTEDAHSATLEASSIPTAPTPAFATLLLIMMPRALPVFSMMSIDLTSEWPLTRFEV